MVYENLQVVYEIYTTCFDQSDHSICYNYDLSFFIETYKFLIKTYKFLIKTYKSLIKIYKLDTEHNKIWP